MPLDQQALKNSIDDLIKVTLESFTATPSMIEPFGQSELSWRVQGATDFNLTLHGNRRRLDVPREGTLMVQPAETTTFTLFAIARGASSTVLGQQTVEVNLGNCVDVRIPNVDILARVVAEVNTIVDEMNAGEGKKVIEVGRAPILTVDENGLRINCSFKMIFIGDFPNGKLDADALIGLRVQGGEIEAFYRNFESDFDAPWVGGARILLGGPIPALMFALRSSNAQSELKTHMLDAVHNVVGSYEMQEGWSPRFVVTEPGQVVVRICPRADVRGRLDYPGSCLSRSTLMAQAPDYQT